MSLYAVIMAGGRGTRFWPMGRINAPKQFLKLTGDKTMLEETVDRLDPLIPPDHILIVTNRNYVERARQLLPQIPADQIIGEPEARQTAPCIALAAAFIRKRDPEATMVVLPADHVIRPKEKLQEVLKDAQTMAAQDFLITIGITPAFPSTGYGYIQCGDRVDNNFYQVRSFKEKPDLETARQFLVNGNFKWNSGMFIWRAGAIYQAFRQYCPELADFMDRLEQAPDFMEFLNAHFKECPKISIDYAVMERADRVLVAEVSFFWSDIGSWNSLHDLYPLDDMRNVRRGKTLALDTSNSIIMSDEETLIGVIGLDNVAVIKSGNGILVCPLQEEQRVRELIRIAEDNDYHQFI